MEVEVIIRQDHQVVLRVKVLQLQKENSFTMDDKIKKELDQLGKSLGDSRKAQKEKIEEDSKRQQEFQKAAKSNFVQLRKNVIVPFLSDTNDSFKGQFNACLSYITNEQSQGVQKVTENFIKVYFHIKGGNKAFPNTPYIEFNLNPFQNKIRVITQVNFRDDGKKLDEEHSGDGLGDSHVSSYLLNFVKECVAFYGG